MKNTFFKLFGALVLAHGMGSCGALAQTSKTLIKADLVEGVDTEYDFLKGAGEFERGNNGSVPKGWVAYADAAGTSPVDGTGGSPTATCTVTSSGIDGKSLRITHTAATNQGNGCSYDFTITGADKTKILSIELESRVGSGTFVAGSLTDRSSAGDSDVTVWVYDKDAAVLLQPTTHRFYSNSTSFSEPFRANYQTHATSTNYRLIFHVGTANTSAFTLDIDKIKIKRTKYNYGTLITDWKSYPPSFGAGFGTVSTHSFFWRRVGGDLEGKGYFIIGTTAASPGTISLPSGLAIDTSLNVLANASNAVGPRVGTAQGNNASNARYVMPLVTATNTSTTLLYLAGAAGLTTNVMVPLTSVSGSLGNGDPMFVDFKVPIAGWGTSTQQSDAADQRPVAWTGNVTTNTTMGNATNLAITSVYDSHGSWDGDEYVIPVAGHYAVSSSYWISAGSDSGAIYLNGSNFAFVQSPTTTATTGYAVLHNLKVGDKISFRSNSSVTVTGSSLNRFTVAKVGTSGAVISATEPIIAKYTTAAGQSVPNTTSTIVNYGTMEIDTHLAVTVGASWKFTAPAAGTYEVCASAGWASSNWNVSSWELNLYKNGSVVNSLGLVARDGSGTNFTPVPSGCTQLKLIMGDYVDVRAYQNNGGGTNLVSNAQYNHVTVKRVAGF